ncbi:Cysteine protease ATG4B [Trichinella britovi]|uniref:Cysteine protease n=2 Tax=Trichinella TaxID=6333 RepID=A0A0V1CS70_TRIBR|nr:Cysteine protease ATG4B [Trichinella britovi]
MHLENENTVQKFHCRHHMVTLRVLLIAFPLLEETKFDFMETMEQSMLDLSNINFERCFVEMEERDLFKSGGEVWIVGRVWQTQDFDDIKKEIRSRMWFTYRKSFSPIGGTGPISDAGWGCMLRCGQMLLAQALICRHLGREWQWSPSCRDEAYVKILRMFQDKKNELYSIHMIAKMGESEGKEIGKWFGPSTIAHVIKKLAIYDDWSSLAVHVAMDNVIVQEDVKKLCSREVFDALRKRLLQEEPSEIVADWFEDARKDNKKVDCENLSSPWKPLLLILPMRLGLSELNPCYIPALKEFFACKYNIGMIGGKPNHALYFIGAYKDRLVYLDPHWCQTFVDLDVSMDLFDDSSYHSAFILDISFNEIDPSLAIAFYINTEAEFDDFCTFAKQVLQKYPNPLFEVLLQRPPTWPPFVPYVGEVCNKISEFSVLDYRCESDEEFEILNA